MGNVIGELWCGSDWGDGEDCRPASAIVVDIVDKHVKESKVEDIGKERSREL